MLKQTLDNVGLGETHQVENVAQVLQNYNLFTGDHALAEAVVREGGEWGLADIENFGEKLGTEAVLELGYLANKFNLN